VLRFTDSLTGDKTEFSPRDPGKVSVYWCGPTVYDAPHLGHARSTLAFDILVRYLRWSGWEVCAVSNITDIDDKIIARAAEAETTEPELSAHFERVFIDEMDRLNIAHPDMRPRATEYVEAMVAVVADLVSGVRYDAVRGWGARRDGEPIARTSAPPLDEAMVGLSGLPPRHLGWGQYRSLGAAALDLCAVADGRLDGYVDCSVDAHGVWDYLGALLVCSEAGVEVVDAFGRELCVLDPEVRRTPVAGAGPALAEALIEARRTF